MGQSPDELADLVTLDDAAFRLRFAGSPVKRIGRDRFLRNVLIAIGNSGLSHFIPILIDRLADPSPLVRAMAIWAVSRLADERRVRQLQADFGAAEVDGAVRDEWEMAVSRGNG
jgi:epoxyqueuosine reductase